MTHMLSFQLEKPLTKKNMCIAHLQKPTPYLCGLVHGQSQVDPLTTVYLSKGESYVDSNQLKAVFLY